MQKRKPHYDLKKIKSLLYFEETREVTQTSRQAAASLGYMEVDDMILIIGTLTRKHFFKSMTTQYDSSLWQDVYKIKDEADKKLYIKLQLSPDGEKAVVVQFKEDTGGGD
jgi:motility quorum-sensing regulator/GCU-specific mRNA interferase toxin